MKNLVLSLVLFSAVSLYADDWPREIQTSQGTITIYEPQIGSFKGDSLRARAAVSFSGDESSAPVFGAVWLDCRASTDRPNRIVYLRDVKVRQIRFPKGNEEQAAKVSQILEYEMPHMNLTFSLDLLLESLETAQKERENARDLDVTPPKIIVVNHPAVLIQIDGPPVLADIEGTSLKRVMGTPYFIVQQPSTGLFYLRGGSIWYRARDVLGPWRQITTPPRAVVRLSEQTKADDESGDDVNDVRLKTGQIPEIIVSTEPTELIATDGAIQMSPIQGTGLLYASNTPSRLFLEIASQNYFVLISGRWFSARRLSGPWSYVASNKLPEDFANIPPGSDCDDVLANVAGTIPAKEAILDAQIPQTAEVDRSQATSEVQYDGDPQFAPIENTDMQYAVNTPTPVIRVGQRYYDCDRAVWFESDYATGPWQVCVNVPSVIYTIPPRYPVYYVRYVRVYGYTPRVAYVGYTAGYTGCYVYSGAVVYGTGYHYRPWMGKQYYARPWTWGFGVHYDPWTGWSFGSSKNWWQPRGWYAYKSHDEVAGWWGPVGYRPVYRAKKGPEYTKGFRPLQHQAAAPKTPAPSASGETRRAGATRTSTMYDRWTSGVQAPTIAPATRSSVGTPRPGRSADANRPSTAQPSAPPTPPSQSQPGARQPSRPAPPNYTQPEVRQPARPVTPTPAPPEVRQPSTTVTPPPSQPDVRQPARPVTPAPSQPEVRQPSAPATQPFTKPEVREPIRQTAPITLPPAERTNPNTRQVTRPPTRENNVFAAPDGSILRKTDQGWQQRDQNSWKDANSAPAKQEVDRDFQVRQRAAERSSAVAPVPTATPVQKPQQSQPPAQKPPEKKNKEKEK